MKNQTYRMTMLYDFYGELLTDRQKEFFDLYYNEDLSLSEIAENNGISRQGVRDVIVRAEGIMQEIEDKTGLIRRFMQMQGNLNAIQEAAEELKTINYRQYENPRVDALVVETVKEAHNKARRLLKENEDQLHRLAAYLLERETITGEEFMALLSEK